MFGKSKCLNKKEGMYQIDYEQGWMTPEEKQAFEENHLAHCAACREQLAFFKPIWKTLRAHPEVIDEIERFAEARAEARRARWRRFLPWALVAVSAAAAAVLLLSVAWMPYRYGVGKEAEVPTLRGGSMAEDLCQMGILHYEQGRYAEAIQPLRRSVETTPSAALREKSRWYLAQAYWKMGDAARGRTILEALLNEAASTSPYKGPAEAWLQSLESVPGTK
ncbi:MAG: tetratricopeptide repeat protein [Acidobacteria bacterium]|nr:tetratricopeptide repeat protein [Acidobacteriota bacterium]